MKLIQKIWASSHLSTKLTLLDQVIVSGCNFLTGILITRLCGLEAYGTFALAWMGVLLASSLQLNFLLKPMMSLSPKMKALEQQGYFPTTQRIQCLLILIVGLVAMVLVWGSDQWFPDWEVGQMFPVLPLAIMMFLAQEYYRRYFFIVGTAFWALLIDGIAYGGLILGIAILGLLGQLDVVMTYWLVCGSFGLAAVMGLLIARIPWQQKIPLQQVLQRHWKFANWLVGTALLQFFASNFFIVAAGAILGSVGVGALRIAQNLMGLTHILFQAMENAVPIKAAQALKQDGFSGMVQYLKMVSIKAGGAIGLILCSVALASEQLIHLVYGQEYIEYSYLLMGYCIFYAFLLPGYPLRYALRSMEFTQPIFVAYVVSTLFSLLAAYPIVEYWGLMGVVYGLIISQLLMQACYVLMIRKQERPDQRLP